MQRAPAAAIGAVKPFPFRRNQTLTTTTLSYDPARLEAAIGRFLNDVGAVITASSVLIGDRLGLYKALADRAQTSNELAERTQTKERYVREWLSNQAAAGYVTYDPKSEKFSLPPEHVPLLADDASEVNMCGLFAMGQPLFADEPKIAEAFRSGKGVGWHEHDARLYALTDRIFRNGYAAHLVADWIPALEGVEAKLRHRCPRCRCRLRLRQFHHFDGESIPDVEFVGYDYHESSIAAAREAAQKAGVAERVRFEVASAKAMPERKFDLICFFDCVHDMGDPIRGAGVRR